MDDEAWVTGLGAVVLHIQGMVGNLIDTTMSRGYACVNT